MELFSYARKMTFDCEKASVDEIRQQIERVRAMDEYEMAVELRNKHKARAKGYFRTMVESLRDDNINKLVTTVLTELQRFVSSFRPAPATA